MTRGLRILVLTVVGVLVVLNAGAVWAALTTANTVTDHAGSGRGVAHAVPVDGSRVLTSTLGGRIELRRDGEVVASRGIGGTVGALAVADRDRFVAGTTLGAVIVLDARLREVDRWDVGDPIVGLRPASGGDLLVAHGSGAFSGTYSIDRFRTGADKPGSRGRVGFTITALAAGSAGDRAVYGTINSQVGMLDTRTGKPRWKAETSQPVTAIEAIGGERILVGDKQGNVELLDAQGRSLGRVRVGVHPVTAFGYDERSRAILVGDRSGELSVLDENGKVVLQRTVAESAVRAIGPGPDSRAVLVPESGRWATIDPAMAGRAGLVDSLRPWWIGLNALGVCALLVSALLAAPSRRTRVAEFGRLMWQGRLGYLLVLPTLALLVVFTFYPAAGAFYYSFTDFSLRSTPEWIGLSNYHQLFTDDAYFRTGLVNMAIIVVASFLKTVTVPLLAAELVYWLRNRVHQYVFRTLFVMSSVVPALVLTLLWLQVYNPETGLLNEILSLVGLDEWRRAWLGDENTALAAVIGVGFPFLTAFAFLIFLGGLLNINRELYDSAAIDGAGRWKRFRHIDLPHLRPQFRIMSFFALVGAVEGFAGIFILTGGGPGMATYVPALQMYERIGTGELGYASTIGVVLFVMILVTTVFILRFRRSDLEVG